MRKDFLTIKNNIAKDIYDTSSQMLALIGNYVNIKYQDALRRVNFNAYNYDHAITTVAGQSDYPLPEDFNKCIGALDATNSTELAEMGTVEELYRNNTSSVSATGNPEKYVIFDSVVMKQPTSASTLSIVSSASSDTTQEILVRGISNGAEVTESITLNGTSAQTTTNSYTRIKGISKDGNTNGFVTVTSNSGAVTLAIMSPKVLVSRYKIVRFFYTPASALTINFPYLLKPMNLVEDNDYPIIDIEDIIEIGAKALAHSYQRREATANKYESLYESMLANYIWSNTNKPNRVNQFQATPYSRNTI